MDLRPPPDPSSPLATLLERRAAERGDSVYLRAARGEASLTFADAAAAGARWRDLLERTGVAPSRRVALALSDPLSFAEAFLGIIAAGRWVVPFDPTMASRDPDAFRGRLRRAGAAYLVDDDHGLTMHDEVAAPDTTDDADRRGGVVMTSSGTTGAPKVMRLNADQLLGTARLVVASHALTSADVGFNPLPLFHINAQVVGLLSTLDAGSTLILADRFHRTDFWSYADQLGVTWINAVPAIISRLLPLREGEFVPPTIRFVRSASAPLSVHLMDSFEVTTGVAVIESFGMTEAASQICVNPLAGPRRGGSVGPATGVELRITIERGGAGATLEVGDVEVRGPTVIRAYEGPGYEHHFTSDGWLRTGDLGYLDDDGYLFLVGRSDDVINRGGEKIYPRDVEEVLLRSDDVAEAAVIGEPDDVFGQVPIAYVRLRDVDERTPVESLAPIVKGLREGLIDAFPRTRRPASLHVVASLPSQVNGKILKGAMRADPPVALISETVG